jgi:hypothetical protein
MKYQLVALTIMAALISSAPAFAKSKLNSGVQGLVGVEADRDGDHDGDHRGGGGEPDHDDHRGGGNEPDHDDHGGGGGGWHPEPPPPPAPAPEPAPAPAPWPDPAPAPYPDPSPAPAPWPDPAPAPAPDPSPSSPNDDSGSTYPDPTPSEPQQTGDICDSTFDGQFAKHKDSAQLYVSGNDFVLYANSGEAYSGHGTCVHTSARKATFKFALDDDKHYVFKGTIVENSKGIAVLKGDEIKKGKVIDHIKMSR